MMYIIGHMRLKNVYSGGLQPPILVACQLQHVSGVSNPLHLSMMFLELHSYCPCQVYILTYLFLSQYIEKIKERKGKGSRNKLIAEALHMHSFLTSPPSL